MEQVFTGSRDTRDMSATTALESTPPLRKAPSGTSAIIRQAVAFCMSSKSSASASSAQPPAPTEKSTSQYSSMRGSPPAESSR